MPVLPSIYKLLEGILFKIGRSLFLVHKKPCINGNNKGSEFFNTPFVDCKFNSLIFFSAYLLNSSFFIECINLLLQYQLLKPYISNVLTFSYSISSCSPTDLALFYNGWKPLFFAFL